jgi:hypothetical protein
MVEAQQDFANRVAPNERLFLNNKKSLFNKL